MKKKVKDFAVCFWYDSEGEPSILISENGGYKNYSANTDLGGTPIYYLEAANFEMWERYDHEIEQTFARTWRPTERQLEMIEEIIKAHPDMALQVVPACKPEEHDSFAPGEVPMEVRTIDNLWSHNKFFTEKKRLARAM